MNRLALALVLSTGCVAAESGFGGDYLDHEEASDFALVSGTFDRNNVATDEFFTASSALTAADIQLFLERSPYGGRCFLADHRTSSGSAAEALVTAARAHHVNPLLLLARLQVEKSLVSKTSRPAQRSIDFALGCGCPDGSSCSSAERGFDRQVECGARVHERWFNASIAGTGSWRRGVRRTSSDGLAVTPSNHATASLYAYTPWVLTGRGGNWLVWSVLKKFVNHAISLGITTAEELDGGAGAGPEPEAPRWIGSACAVDSDCTSLGLSGQRCFSTGEGQGFCTASCEGTCPDRSGFAVTFCASLDGGASGSCVAKSASQNVSCAAVPGTSPSLVSRFIGRSGRPAAQATACIPSSAPELCENSCSFARDGVCDDGGSGASFAECALGSDCADCGMR
jgi:hypothetical protein